MKVAIITDQHFGARKNSKLFHDYFLQFYNEVFFPTLEEEGITAVVDMGDTFDSRKGIDFSALAWAKDNYYDRLKELGCTVHTIVGNHTTYYKNTSKESLHHCVQFSLFFLWSFSFNTCHVGSIDRHMLRHYRLPSHLP